MDESRPDASTSRDAGKPCSNLAARRRAQCPTQSVGTAPDHRAQLTGRWVAGHSFAVQVPFEEHEPVHERINHVVVCAVWKGAQFSKERANPMRGLGEGEVAVFKERCDRYRSRFFRALGRGRTNVRTVRAT